MSQSLELTAIINPAARSGKLRARMDEVVKALEKEGILVKRLITEGPNHATELAHEASRTADVILAVGGDGTVHEVARGILESKTDTSLAIMPCGTGNDFARMIGMSKDPSEAARQLITAVRCKVDVGRVTWLEDGEKKSGTFINAIGIGFDGYAASIAPRYKGLPFGMGYLVSILAALKTWVPCGVTVWDESKESEVRFSGPLFFVTIGNARDSAGGYRINPKASIVDGKLDVCLVEAIGYFRALRMLPTTRNGSHLKSPEVKYWHTNSIRIDADRSLPVHVDGEMLSISASGIEISVDSGALNVLIPSDYVDSI